MAVNWMVMLRSRACGWPPAASYGAREEVLWGLAHGHLQPSLMIIGLYSGVAVHKHAELRL